MCVWLWYIKYIYLIFVAINYTTFIQENLRDRIDTGSHIAGGGGGG